MIDGDVANDQACAASASAQSLTVFGAVVFLIVNWVGKRDRHR